VVADGRLRLRQLWRRNREGSLWRPRWWPADLAPLLWPLLLVVALALPLTLALLLRPHGQAVAPEARPQLPPLPVSQEHLAQERAAAEPLAPESNATQAFAPDASAPDPGPINGEPQQLELDPERPLAADPLDLLLQRPGADGLIRRAEAHLDSSSLSLQLAPAFPALDLNDQQRSADLWLQWAHELGYDHLELRDSRSGLLGRDALVGDGMILFSQQPRA